MAPAEAGPSAPEGPDPVLVGASAMVFVTDPAAPVLDGADLHHLLDVLRLRPGEVVVAGDGAGRWVPCRVAPAAGRGARAVDPSALLVPDAPAVTAARPAPVVTVAFAPTKGERPEWVVQKLTEVGVDRIVPLVTARSIVRWEGERAARSVARLRRVAREAAAQSRRLWLPEVGDVCRLGDLAASVGAPVSLAEPGGGAPSLARPAVAVGPEGGWEEAERCTFDRPVGLGPTVLRAETAALVAGAALCGLRARTVAPLRNHAP